MSKTNTSKIKYNKNKEVIIDVDQILDSELKGHRCDSFVIDDKNEYDLIQKYKEILGIEVNVKLSDENSGDFDKFHQEKSHQWLLPDNYLCIDVKDYLLNKCKTSEETERVNYEYNIYETRGLVNVLRLMIYIVDKMRENDIVWGVGRGSSVSSYCLYLIGVHKVDSIKYNLDVTEFFK